MTRVALVALLVLAALVLSCARAETAVHHDDVILRAQSFIDSVDVDPVALRARGDKGKKHYVELLDAYRWLARACRDRGGVECTPNRIAALARFADDGAFHNMMSE